MPDEKQNIVNLLTSLLNKGRSPQQESSGVDEPVEPCVEGGLGMAKDLMAATNTIIAFAEKAYADKKINHTELAYIYATSKLSEARRVWLRLQEHIEDAHDFQLSDDRMIAVVDAAELSINAGNALRKQ